jgi:hypothetical protein
MGGEVMLFLRTCKKDGSSYGGYKWNLETGAINEAPDYNDRAECGGGLHGIKNGVGDAGYLNFSDDSIGVVFSADADIIEFDGKAKVKCARIEFVGTVAECAEYIHAQTGLQGIIMQKSTAGVEGQATAGDRGQATAGYSGQATAGVEGTIIIKYWDGKRYKYKIGYTGEDVKPNTKYRLNDKNEFEEVKQ